MDSRESVGPLDDTMLPWGGPRTERRPSKLNVAGSRPVSRSSSPFVLSTTLSLFAQGA